MGNIFALEERTFEVRKLDWSKNLEAFVKEHHYTQAAAIDSRYAFGLIEADTLLGVITFGRFVNLNSIKKYVGCLELNRMIILDGTPKNTASSFISRCLQWLDKNTNLYGIISYTSPSEGHTGAIYKATNFQLIGQTEKSYYYLNGRNRIHKRGVWKRARTNGIHEIEQAKTEELTRVDELPKLVFKFSFERKHEEKDYFVNNLILQTPSKRPLDWDDSHHACVIVKNKEVFLDVDCINILNASMWFIQNKYLSKRDEFRNFVLFHRVLMDHPEGMVVHHRNKNRLDNRRINLHVVPIAVNNHDQIRAPSKLGRGVKARGSSFLSKITFNTKVIYIGSYPTKEEAQKAYDLKAVECFGKYANTNFDISNYQIPEHPLYLDIAPKSVVQNVDKRFCTKCDRIAVGNSEFCKTHKVATSRSYESLNHERVIFVTDSCIHAGCSGEVFARNLCSTHYTEARKKEGYVKPEGKNKYMCSIDGCGKDVYRKKLCFAHYRIEYGLSKPLGRPKKSYGVCSQCLSQACGKHGFCKNHYVNDWRKRNSYSEPRKKCSILECQTFANHKADRLCQKHWRVKFGIPKKRLRKDNPVVRRNPCAFLNCENLGGVAGAYCSRHKEFYTPRTVGYRGKAFGKILKESRVKSGKTVVELILAAGFDKHGWFSHVEQGNVGISIEKFAKINAVLCISEDNLSQFKTINLTSSGRAETSDPTNNS